jgi:hypothetical protein
MGTSLHPAKNVRFTWRGEHDILLWLASIVLKIAGFPAGKSSSQRLHVKRHRAHANLDKSDHTKANIFIPILNLISLAKLFTPYLYKHVSGWLGQRSRLTSEPMTLQEAFRGYRLI